MADWKSIVLLAAVATLGGPRLVAAANAQDARKAVIDARRTLHVSFRRHEHDGQAADCRERADFVRVSEG